MARPPARTAAPSTNWQKAPLLADTDSCLVVGPQWLGDAVMAQPLLADLARRGPVDVLSLAALAPVYQAMPGVRRVWPVEWTRGKLEWSARRALAQTLRSEAYPRAVVCPNSWKAALVPWMAGIPKRRGLRGEWRLGLLNDIRRPQADTARGPSQPAQYAALADTPESALRAAPALHAPTAPAQAERPDTAHTDAANLPGLLVICPGAAYGPAKQWPAEHFAAVATDWLEHGGRVAILGTGADRDTQAVIAGRIPAALQARLEQRAGDTSLVQAMAILSDAQAVVSNDSGLMHVAAALGRPVIGIYGSTDPQHTPARGPSVSLVSAGLGCSPCFQRTCPLQTTACLKDIAPERILQLLPPRNPGPHPQ